MARTLLLIVLAALVAGCRTDPTDTAVQKGLAFLVGRQAEDGAWRSTVVPPFADGPTLTPIVLKAVLYTPGGEEAAKKGQAYLTGLDETELAELAFPVYTYASAAMVLEPPARDPWLERLKQHQMTEALGWSPDDPEYGGWGEALTPPRKKPGEPDRSGSPTISTTLFALGALRKAGVPADDPLVEKAARFVLSCRTAEGGFVHAPGNPIRNKAGEQAYGSATADGLQALLLCGFAHDSPEVEAAHNWLRKHFQAHQVPGPFTTEKARQSVYYYWCWSAGHLLKAFPDREWARPLSQALLEKQNPDGSWTNPVGDMTENDPLVATPFALSALVMCRQVLSQ